MSQFVKAKDDPRGKRAQCVAGMIQQLIDAEGAPVPWDRMNDEVGMDHHGQLMPAFHALEMVGAVERYTYAEAGSTKARVAFALHPDVEVK